MYVWLLELPDATVLRPELNADLLHFQMEQKSIGNPTLRVYGTVLVVI